jgi:hypothetical protein
MASRPKPLEYSLLSEEVEPMDGIGTGLPSHRRRGSAPWQWLVIASVCIVGGFYLANFLYVPKAESGAELHLHLGKMDDLDVAQAATPTVTDVVIRAPGDMIVHDKRFNLNPFALFTSGNAAVRVRVVSRDCLQRTDLVVAPARLVSSLEV